ncbi:hypothetical protein [Microbacterium sp. 179-I 3D3 NHS]|uniref:hypothetical protein n=1 Tax=unclassified Microbacterium TaxID=2609290 RepID=UPI00399F5FC8
MSADDWARLLDRLEDDADRILDAESGTVDAMALPPWTTPAAPLPPELADRAQRVIARQRAAMDRVRAEQDRLRPHLEAVSRVPPARQPDTPVYLDRNG